MNTQDLVVSYINVLKEAGVKVEEAYMFGSHVKGNFWEGSDVDVCVLSSDFATDYDKWSQKLDRLTLKVDSRIEPVLFTREEFENKYDALAGEIKRFGLRVA